MPRRAIILFDGVCNLCNTAVQFVINRDNTNYFLFASLQSAGGTKLLAENNMPPRDMYSFLLLEDGKIYDRSTAALRVVRKLKGMWKCFYAFIIIPKFIRDAVYQVIAKKRYQWFGIKNECMIPTPELREKFIN